MTLICCKCKAENTDFYSTSSWSLSKNFFNGINSDGAALIYTSVKENKNIDLVYKYIVQKLYGFPYKIPAVVVEKDAVFIPAGWDNDKKIGILHENFQTLKAEDNFEDIITKPPVRKFVHEKEIVAEDDQVFLMKLQV